MQIDKKKKGLEHYEIIYIYIYNINILLREKKKRITSLKYIKNVNALCQSQVRIKA